MNLVMLAAVMKEFTNFNPMAGMMRGNYDKTFQDEIVYRKKRFFAKM